MPSSWKRPFRAVVASAAIAGLVFTTGCGLLPEAEGSSDGEDSLSVGTTEAFTSMDPAGAWDTGSSTMHYNVYEQLMRVPEGEQEPVGDAAKSCEYTDDTSTTMKCVLRDGLVFQNGHKMTSSDVLFSFKRNLEIADENGPSSLMGAISNGSTNHPGLAKGAIETPDAKTVVFHLNYPDRTFLALLAFAGNSIVDEESYPAGKILENDQATVGSGPYTLAQFDKGNIAMLRINQRYTGPRMPDTDTVYLQFFGDPLPLRNAVGSGQVDVAWSELGPADLSALEDDGSVNIYEGEGADARYWAWILKGRSAKEVAVRQAVAQLIDRDAIAKKAYTDTVEPAYSLVPDGLDGSTPSFKEEYGSPSASEAKKLLDDAGIDTPVELEVGFSTTRLPNAGDEANELKRQLEESGLFSINLHEAEWEKFQENYLAGEYDLFHIGWTPDFLDSDNYLAPFLRDGGFMDSDYNNAEINRLLDQEIGEKSDAKRTKAFEQIQEIATDDVPVMPSWVGKNIAVARPGVTGVKETLDESNIFRFWTIGKE